MEKNVVYCLLCNEPQLSISTHLSRVCLKDGTAQEREQEASRATASQELFSKEGRLWSISELQEFCKDATSCIKLCSRLQSRGFIFTDAPQTWPTVLPTQRSDKKEVLIVAKKDIEYFHQKLAGGDCIPNVAMTTFRQYCEAILMLQHGLTSSAVQDFSVQDWMERRESLRMTIQEEELLECYFKNIRPVSLRNQRAGSDDGDRFFLGEGGVPLTNPALDVGRLRARYLRSDTEDPAAGSASHSAGVETPGQARSTSTKRLPLREWDAFQRTFPVTLNGEPPSKRRCVQAGFPHYRAHYHKWRELQLKQRVQHILGVIALMPFNKGDVVCDYHGTCITKAAGNRRRQSGSLFFYRDECHRADATASPCACHLHKDSYGRHINHCQRNPNVRPQRFTMNFPAGPRESVLFIALRDIAVGEELLWDYGV
ncbi:uncharacterized protein LOC116331962 isoform X3 [Oreochromis aureus]|uniref:uncharacterized protein LOC116331962 isoform X3 n=1 Tax=Oreochromis aureus TaxID=47969 RepID=UPI001953581B|nr:uncharacterized protein LOC116331962 isoform X3 [Oreochromis aureus]